MGRFVHAAYEEGKVNFISSGGSDELFRLGLMYSAGREVAPDLVAAHKWFNIAALRGHASAKLYRLEIARDMSRSDIARAQRLAREWLARNSGGALTVV